MLTIRKDQLDALARAPRREFEDQLVAHCFRCYPKECAQVRAPQVRKLARRAADDAEKQGYRTGKEFGFYISLMMSLGVYFATDPQLPWNRELGPWRTLRERCGPIEELFDRAMAYLDQTAGNGNEFLIRALIRIRKFDLALSPEPGDGEFVAKVCGHLQSVYPEKYQDQGEELNRKLVAEWALEAKQFGLSGGRGVVLYSALCFLIGSGCAFDPMYPWLEGTLEDRSLDPVAKTERLHRLAMQHVDESLS